MILEKLNPGGIFVTQSAAAGVLSHTQVGCQCISSSMVLSRRDKRVSRECWSVWRSLRTHHLCWLVLRAVRTQHLCHKSWYSGQSSIAKSLNFCMDYSSQVYTPVNRTLREVFPTVTPYAAHVPSFCDTWVCSLPMSVWCRQLPKAHL